MRLRDFWTTLVRRWYLVLVAFALAIAATLFIIDRVGPTYHAEGSVLVFPPVTTVQRDTGLQVDGNPYLTLDGVKMARDVVIRALTSKAAAGELTGQFPGASFDATPDFTNGAPIILLMVDANTAEEATTALTTFMARVPEILTGLQSGLNLSPDATITSRPLLADPAPDVLHKDQIRAGIVAGVAALTLSLLLVGLLDGLLTGRAARRPENQRHGGNEHETATSSARAQSLTPARRGQESTRRLGPRAPATPQTRRTNASDHDSEPTQSAVRRQRTVTPRVESPQADALASG